MARVYFPETYEEMVYTYTKLLEKHRLLGADSELKVIKNVDFTAIEQKFEEFKSMELEAVNYDNLAKQARERRDLRWSKELKTPLMTAKDILISLYKDEPYMLELWGFPTTKVAKRKKKSNNETTTAFTPPAL